MTDKADEIVEAAAAAIHEAVTKFLNGRPETELADKKFAVAMVGKALLIEASVLMARSVDRSVENARKDAKELLDLYRHKFETEIRKNRERN